MITKYNVIYSQNSIENNKQLEYMSLIKLISEWYWYESRFEANWRTVGRELVEASFERDIFSDVVTTVVPQSSVITCHTYASDTSTLASN